MSNNTTVQVDRLTDEILTAIANKHNMAKSQVVALSIMGLLAQNIDLNEVLFGKGRVIKALLDNGAKPDYPRGLILPEDSDLTPIIKAFKINPDEK